MDTGVIRIELDTFAHRGEAIGRQDGQVVFVAGGIPGETVDVEVYQRKHDFLRGRVRDVVSSSADRVLPPCPYFGVCGGCQLQHVAYSRQLALKEEVVRDQMRRIGAFPNPEVRPPLGMDHPWAYRNHARFSALRDGRLGLTRQSSRRIVPIDSCHIMDPRINETLAKLQGRCRRLFNVSVRCGVHTGDVLVAPRIPAAGDVVETGQAELTETLLGKRFRIAAASFFQVNTLQAERLAQLVIDRLALSGGEVVVDAYCGVGTFGALLADKAKRVVGIEQSPAALADAALNVAGLANVELIQGATEDALPGLAERVDAVVLDPPRAGCRPEVLATLARLRPGRLVYVSCDTATLARDLRTLVDGGFALEEVQPVDMFPHTYHVENVATLAWAR